MQMAGTDWGFLKGPRGRAQPATETPDYLGTSAVLLEFSIEENLRTVPASPEQGVRGPEWVSLALDPNPQRSQFKAPASTTLGQA